METNLNEKKWFIYIGDHHEGPFTVKEIHDGIAAGKFSPKAFVWHQHLSDWTCLADLTEFQAQRELELTKPEIIRPEPTKTSTRYVADDEASKVIVQIKPLQKKHSPEPMPLSIEDAQQYRVVRPEYVSEKTTATSVEKEVGFSSSPRSKKKEWLSNSQMRAVFLILAIGALGGSVWNHPAGHEWMMGIISQLSPFPNLPDVDPSEYEQLKLISKAPLSNGVMTEIAVSKMDPLSPSFYIASNLGEGAKFEVYVEGVPHTLLNTLSFSGKLTATIQKRVGKTEPLRYPNGRVIPRGEYKVYVMEAESGQPDAVNDQLTQMAAIPRTVAANLPKNRKIVYEKNVFLGDRDQTYLSRLKEFHDNLAKKATDELAELRQIQGLLESQFMQTNADFDRLKVQILGPRQISAWQSSALIWKQLDEKLNQSLLKFTQPNPESEAEWIHYNLYRLAQMISVSLNQLHASQDSFFTQKATLEQLQDSEATARLAIEKGLLEFKSALTVVEGAPLDQNGMPNKAVLNSEVSPNGT